MSALKQIQNPKTKKYILIDREKGVIVEHREIDGPYPDIEIITKPKKLCTECLSNGVPLLVVDIIIARIIIERRSAIEGLAKK
jgi:hypothetical protein